MNQRELFLRHVAQTSEEPLLGYDMNVVSASGVLLRDASGKEYIDLISGISVSTVGHCHPKVVNAVCEQSKKFMHLMVYGEFNQSPQVKYATSLCVLLPAGLDSVYFTTGGSEAVEGALKLAKRITGRQEIVSFSKAYHGSTHGALSVMGDEFFKNSFRPLLPGITILEFSNEQELELLSTDTAAVIIELIQGEAGIRKADPSFILKLRKKCTELGIVLIVDEIQTGFGRTGSLFAFEQFNIVPDILVIAKGMGGGMPIGAFISSLKNMSALSSNPVLGHINTFGGNAVCVAAAQATLEVVCEDRLSERAVELQQLITKHLSHPLIKELRICGALGAIDFEDEGLCRQVIRSCLEQGILTDWFLFCPTAMRIAPPLTISDEDLIKALRKLLDILNTIKR